ncbi:MAG: nickel pincer cofactor biosynthesis protein LarB [Nitrospina sp.]|jgi:pyridinium-3,5-biscarboxylic acid mononucleotide synthase|nr:nickel pincer cofactor biosynthesis protein LarB [Nitrospina sp.]MBT5633680.1 nickel pincer cofactor biosynthesis protein LarB [Nitrospina sp.]
MNPQNLKKLLEDLHKQKFTPQQALKKLKTLPYENLEFAKVDHHRDLRSGMPEVIYCQGKTVAQIKKIIQSMNRAGHSILATKLSKDSFRKLKPSLPKTASYNEMAQTLVIDKNKSRKKKGLISIITAGTSDIPIAEEASITAELLGSQTETHFDVGVAGIHRLFNNLEQIRKARVVIVVAGMEGALASVVGGLVDKPLIAVPTSIGYGTSFGGVSALLTMLNSCSPGIAVVNIDNGFGAGSMAHRINILGDQIETE